MKQRYTAIPLLFVALFPLVAQGQAPTGTMPGTPQYTLSATDPVRGGAPANDECDGAELLTVATECTPVAGSITGATQSFAPSECDGETAVAAEDVWYAFNATFADLIVTLDPAFDGILGVYEGSCSDLSLVQCHDQAGNGMEQIFLEGLSVGSTYYVRVYALDVNEVEDPSFTVCIFPPPPGHCLASSANTGYEVIDNVSLDDVVNASTDTIGYEDFTDIVAEVSPGASMVLVVSVGNEYPSDVVNAWADFDRNEEFDESEHIMNSEGESPHAADVPIPDGIGPGDVRLRIRVQDSDYDAVASPCYNTFYGQVEDYTLHVTDPGGIHEQANAPWRMYTDPSSGDLVLVHMLGAARPSIQVLDMTGRLVFQGSRILPAGTPVRLAFGNDLPPGSYVVRVSSGPVWHAQRFVQR